MSDPRLGTPRPWAWLRPGLRIKRYLLPLLAGVVVAALGVAFALRALYREVDLPTAAQDAVSSVTLQWLPYEWRGLLLLAGGAGLILFGLRGLARTVLGVVHAGDRGLLLRLDERRRLAAGPRIAVLGGGTGLATLLRGLKEHSSRITAIVTTADDGGSSGVLRERLGIGPVGDLRNCLIALAEHEDQVGELLAERVELADGQPSHAVGNLLLAAALRVEHGDLERAARRVGETLRIRGAVVPASEVPTSLIARLDDGGQLEGESAIGRSSARIARLELLPSSARATASALVAIREADLVVLGPGSLYTSVLPCLLVPGIAAALRETGALVIWAGNVAEQPGETDALTLADHLEILERHAPGLLDVVLANDPAAIPQRPGDPPALELGDLQPDPAGLWVESLADPARPHHHDPRRLAAALLRIARADRRTTRGLRSTGVQPSPGDPR